jgi:transcription elongation factor SPT6
MAVWEKIRKGPIAHLVKSFGMSASDFGVNVKEGTKRYWTEDPSIAPEELAKDYEEEFGSPAMALSGILFGFPSLSLAAKQMFTETIFHDPNVRKFFRELLLGSPSQPSRAGYAVHPTERGIKRIDETHPYYVYLLHKFELIAALQIPHQPTR